MGATFLTFIADDLAKAKAMLKEKQDHDASYYGHDPYSGGWNLCRDATVRDLKLPSADAAEAWEMKHQLDKGEVLIVSFYGKTKADKRKEETAQKRRQAARDKLRAASEKAFSNLKSAKSAFVGCKVCKSRLARQHVKEVLCPLCGASLLSPTVQKQIAALASKLNDVSMVATAPNHGKLKWMVIGCAPI